MENTSISEEILKWVEGLEYWEQYLSVRILNRQKLGEAEIKAAYKYFAEDAGLAKKPDNLRPVITLPTGSGGDGAALDFQLKAISDVAGVNALKENESISISPNLTIIYGENGAGKSGYIRLLNNAFISRGDTHLEPNVYSDEDPKDAGCTFTFIKGDHEYDLQYPDHGSRDEFGAYAVFDTYSITAHLNHEDEIKFLPSGLDFFDHLSRAYERVKTLLTEEYTRRTPENQFVIHFEKETSVKKIVEDLDGATDLNVVREKATLADEEKDQLSEAEKQLLELRKTDVGKKVNKLKTIRTLLGQLKTKVERINELLSADSLPKYERLFEKYAKAKALSSKEGIEQFKTDDLAEVGEPEWKELIVAAQEFAAVQNEDEDAYPTNGDICLLCRQPLSKEARTLLDAYWKYLTSTAEKDVKTHGDKIENGLETFSELETKILEEDSVLHAWLSDYAEGHLKIWLNEIRVCEAARKKVVSAFKSKKWSAEIATKQISVKPFAAIEKIISDKIGGLNETEINRKIKEKEKLIAELKDRKKLSTLLDKIEKFVKDHKWALRALRKPISTRKVTTKQKELFTAFVTDEYVKIFNSECKKLNANFGIEISQRAQKGNTYKHLELRGTKPGAILSEGEQRALSIADFLTEVQIGNKNRGIIFDDPVNSLDHVRRQIIAERLIEESKVRQVIVFTHDITFLLALQALAEEHSTDKLITTMRKIGDVPGIVNKDIPWIATNVKQRIGRLTEMLVELKKTEKGGDTDRYALDAKAWCGLLRETWERAIEQLLFNDAIQRFSPGIQTKRIENIKYTPDLYKQIDKGMTECSNWVHDQARAVNTPAPDYAKLESFLKSFKDFAALFK